MIPHALIRAAARIIWMRSKPRAEALKRQKVRGIAKAAICNWCLKMTLKPEIDHIVPCGPTPGSRNATDETTWDGFFSRLFCHAGGLQVLCPSCHAMKTQCDSQ